MTDEERDEERRELVLFLESASALLTEASSAREAREALDRVRVELITEEDGA